MDLPNFEGSDGQQPFNMGIATLMRIDACLKMLSAFQKVRHKTAVIRHLRELHKELYPFMKPDDREEAWQRFDNIQKNLKNPNIWEILDELDYYLRDQLYKRGLLMHRGMDPNFAVMGGGMG